MADPSQRRQALERSLLELQGDISRLSQKLHQNVNLSVASPPRTSNTRGSTSSKIATPGTLTPSEFKDVAASPPKPAPFITTPEPVSKDRDIVSMILEKTSTSSTKAPSATTPPQPPQPPTADLSSFSLPSSTTSSPYRYSSPIGNRTSFVDESASTPKIQKVMSEIAAQRDASIERVKALQRQNLDLKAKLHEATRWKEMCEALERERESLTLSLSSSERIRKQQKDLIKLLQENGGRTANEDLAQSILDPNSSMLLSVNNDSFSFVDITNTSPLSQSFTRTEGRAEGTRTKASTPTKKTTTQKSSLTPGSDRRRSVSSVSSTTQKKLTAVMEAASKPPPGGRRRSSTADAALAGQITGGRSRSNSRRPSIASSVASSVTMNEASPKGTARRKLSLKSSPKSKSRGLPSNSPKPSRKSSPRNTPKSSIRRLSLKIPSVGGSAGEGTGAGTVSTGTRTGRRSTFHEH